MNDNLVWFQPFMKTCFAMGMEENITLLENKIQQLKNEIASTFSWVKQFVEAKFFSF